MKEKLAVAFLWHMHQPLYKDLRTGKYHLPWVRLHSTYSYLDMASAVAEFPRAKCTFNITPSLIWQLRDLSKDGPVDDVFLSLSEKDASKLTEDEKCFILKNFFSCDLEKAIFPIRRYKELFYMRGESLRKRALKEKARDFRVSDLRDLQVFFNLAWCGFTLKEKDKLVRRLLKKGSGYTEEEKLALLRRQKEVVRSILPLYKELQDKGQIEITTSPFYHPILPLMTGGSEKEGYDLAEDARTQVKRGIELYEEVFGKRPEGMWPPEGGVSEEIIPILADEGVKWIATDEGILLESFSGEGRSREDLIYNAFTAGKAGREMDMIFRDIHLSNAISFTYANMPQKKAVANLLHDIEGIRRYVSEKDGEHIASVILDGENPWPYFPDGGKYFLSEIYRRLSSLKGVETVTAGGYLKAHKERKRIGTLHAGSWIDRNFRKWIGSPQKNKAWEYLERTRREAFSGGTPAEDVLEELYIAEGSDWFWWYDDFGSELNFVFDELFRIRLANVYRLLGRKVPYYLEKPIHAGPSARKVEAIGSPAEMPRFPKVLFVSSEVMPFSKTGGLADVAGSLPKALAGLGCDVRVVTPLYKCVAEGWPELAEESSRVKQPLSEARHGFDIFSERSGGVTAYFIKEKKFFFREGLYGTSRGDYPDNGQRFAFLCAAALGAVKALGFKPDIIHCNDWQTALIPFYLKFRLSGDEDYKGIRTVFTIHNMAYQGLFSRKIMHRIGIPDGFFNMSDLEFYGRISFMKSGVLYSDIISTVSHKYAEEIMTPEYGCGLDGLLRTSKNDLYGIPNGADYTIWSPGADRMIKSGFDPGHLEGKAECKKDLIERTGLAISPETPLLGCVTRLADQKGMDLVADIMDRIVGLGAGVVILGRGSRAYNRLFTDLAKKYPGNVHTCNEFNDELAHKIEAGCDIFLMPSRYEPCGLNQMYSIKYGTIPVVRATGGLDDVIVDHDEDRDNGNGFKFGPATEEALYGAIERAVDLYRGDKASWKKLMVRAMEYDFSWEHSAKQYMALYRKLMG